MHMPFVCMVKLIFLRNSQCISLSTQSFLVLYSLYANLLHSLMCLVVSSLSPRHALYFASRLFLPWHNKSLWGCFELLSEEIQLLSWFLSFLDMSKFSHDIFRFCATWNVHTIVFLLIFFCWCFCCLLFLVTIIFHVAIESVPRRYSECWRILFLLFLRYHNFIIVITPLEFVTSVLADGFSLEFEW